MWEPNPLGWTGLCVVRRPLTVASVPGGVRVLSAAGSALWP